MDSINYAYYRFFEDKRHDVFVLQDVLGVERFIDNLLIVNR